MKKLGFLLALAVFTPGAMADKAGAHFPNVAIVVAETGTSISWAAQQTEKAASRQMTEKLNEKAQMANLKVNIQLQQRINDMLGGSLEQ